jgi:hypothetical protein
MTAAASALKTQNASAGGAMRQRIINMRDQLAKSAGMYG